MGDAAAALGKLRYRNFGGTACSILKECVFPIEVILERLTKPLNVSPADEYAGKREKRLVDIGTEFVADASSAEAVQPAQRAFDHPAPFI